MPMRCIAALIFALFCVGQAIANDSEWPRFRGPNGTGVSGATNLPVEFGPEKNVVWKTSLPPGHSSPVLARTRIYLTAHTPIDAKNKADYQLRSEERRVGKESQSG